MTATVNLAVTVTGATQTQPLNSQTFAEALAAMGLPLIEDFVFGANAVAGPGQTAITNLTELATYYTPFPANNGEVMINSQIWGIPQPFGPNHAFATDHLALTATLSPGFSVQPLAFVTIANLSEITIASTWLPPATVPVTAYNLPAGFTPQVGNLIAHEYSGVYWVVTTSGTGSSMKLGLWPVMGSPGSLNGGASTAAFLQAAVAWCSSVSGTTITLGTAIPSYVKAGWYCASNASGGPSVNWNSPCTILSVDPAAGTITVDQVPPNLSGNNLIMFPPTQSATIARTATYWPGYNGLKAVAFSTTLQLPPANGLATSFTPSTLPATAGCGFWPACWFYSILPVLNSSEADEFEIYFSNTQVPIGPLQESNGECIGPGAGATTYYPGNVPASGDLTAAQHTSQMIVVEGVGTWRYLDGVLWKVDTFTWEGTTPPQRIFDFAQGGLAAWEQANYQMPMNDGAYPASFNLYRATVYGA